MQQKSVIVAIFIALTGCSKGGDEVRLDDAKNKPGSFSGTVSANEYRVDISCSDFDKEYFRFKSDASDITDSNGDGIMVSGMENSGRLTLTIIDNGRTFNAGGVENYAKGNNQAKGSGNLFEEGAADAHDVRFTVTCG